MNRFGWRHSARYWSPALWPLGLGIAWIVLGASAGPVALVLGLVVGLGLLATGGGAFLWGLDRMIVYHLALAAVVAGVGGVIAFVVFAASVAIVLLLAAVGVYLVAGWAGLLLWQAQSKSNEEPPLRLVHHAALDCTLMGAFVHCADMPGGANDFASQIDDLETLESVVQRRGTITAAGAAPRPPSAVDIRPLSSCGMAAEWLAFNSAYTPDPALPGAERWQSFTANQTVGARLLRHTDGPRPWLVCIHGYRMGSSLDMHAFQAERLHREFGVNICMPLLPLHGTRRATRLTGGYFLDGSMINVWHAVSQTLADLRQIVAWLRATQSPTGIGAFGLSLGGYSAALLAAFEPALSPIIAAIPMVEIAPTLWQHMHVPSRARLAHAGFDAARLNQMLAPVSPLAHAPPVTAERAIVAARADQVVPPDGPRALWHHWRQPPIHWSDAGHLSIQRRSDVRAFIDRFVGAMPL
ncbi:hypothetical protein HKX42_03105 [Salinisphaera sp. USBA-960]|uniref:alpha/beta hydrolase n=1 Tax=Salinisphaera orenii TaxID=856731 RepID=UPI000DBE7481|nr:hypothetical protein [Salifodinibacter halophilus]NNC25866.1 hypothetical protein [Salifodinibacter halophilus]